MRLPSLYFAAPLFSNAELEFNLRITALLEESLDVYLPQRDGGLLVDLVSKGVSLKNAYDSIFQRDVLALRNCDICLIVLDGRSVDEGAAFELGYAYAFGKTCVAMQTDPRRLVPLGNNPMLQCALTEIFTNTSSLIGWAQRFTSTYNVEVAC